MCRSGGGSDIHIRRRAEELRGGSCSSSVPGKGDKPAHSSAPAKVFATWGSETLALPLEARALRGSTALLALRASMRATCAVLRAIVAIPWYGCLGCS